MHVVTHNLNSFPSTAWGCS